jgi:hypothetical protein
MACPRLANNFGKINLLATEMLSADAISLFSTALEATSSVDSYWMKYAVVGNFWGKTAICSIYIRPFAVTSKSA